MVKGHIYTFLVTLPFLVLSKFFVTNLSDGKQFLEQSNIVKYSFEILIFDLFISFR